MRTFRGAPSPTGHLHLGHAKMHIINYALAKACGGRYILRIEDTDTKRNKMETVNSMLRDITWLGVTYDAGPEGNEPNEYFQSQRYHIYREYVQQLLDSGKAYKAYETAEERAAQIEEQRKKGQMPVYSGAHADLTKAQQEAFEVDGRKPVIRLRIPKNEIIELNDAVYGIVKTNTNILGDMVIQKSDGSPMYNFAVVIDDHLMEVTDVVRGFGHLSNTPKQIIFYNTFGWELPTFAHFSDILNENEPGKLAKRKGAKPISQYRAEGYLPDAIFNYIIVISCSFTFKSKEEEVMSRDEIYSKVSLDKVLKSNAKFNSQKLSWFNGQHIRKLSSEALFERFISWLENDAKDLKEFKPDFETSLIDTFLGHKELVKEALPLVHERINTFEEALYQLKFLFFKPKKEEIDITPSKSTPEEFVKVSKDLYNLITSLEIPWTHETWESSLRALADNLGLKHGDLFMILRLLIVGERFSPPLFEAMQVLGKEACLERINNYTN
jgi:nondiscriminating glutamyl-tRNA synthetase